MFSLFQPLTIRFPPQADFLLNSFKLLIGIKWGFHHHNELMQQGRAVSILALFGGAAAFMLNENIKYWC